MALGSCYTCIKYLMFAFNFLFWLLGCAILGVGIWLRVDDSAAEFLRDSDTVVDYFYKLAYVMMAIGFLIMIIGFLGCCGAIRESQCMLFTFFIFLFLIFAALLGFGIWAAVEKGSVRQVTHDVLKEGVDQYYKNPRRQAFMDSVQTYFDCCGYEKGFADYVIDIGSSPPASCEGSYTKPCNDAFYDWVDNRLMVIAGICIGVAVIMILGMVFSMVLCCAIRDTVA